MRILADRSLLSDALGRIASIIPSRSPRPILQNAKLVVAESGSTLMATDLEVFINASVLGIKVDQPGAVILPMPKVGQILKSSTDDELSIEVEGDSLVIKGHRSKFQLPSEDPELFPDPPTIDGEGYTVDPADLRRAIRRTAFATDPDSTRYALSGVLFEFADHLTCVGTDGRRLARQVISCSASEGATAPEKATVVPVKALRLIERNLDDDEPVSIVADGNAVLIRSGRSTIHSRLVEGRFPNYRAIFPKAEPHIASFERAVGLLSAVEQAAIVTDKVSRGVDFTFGDGLVKLASQTADIGESHVEAAVEYSGPELAITFDHSYLADALRTLDDDQAIRLEVIDHKSAATMKTDDEYSYILMPLNREGRV